MRKRVALFLAVLLSIGVLSGCTPAELEYLELSREMNRAMSGELSGQAELKVDLNAIMQTVSGEEGQNADQSRLILGANGMRSITVKWDGAYNRVGGFREQLHVQCGLEGKNYDLGTVYMDLMTGDVTMSKDGVLTGLDVMQAFDFDSSACYAYTKEYKEALTRKLKDCEWITWNLYRGETIRSLMQQIVSSLYSADGEESKLEEAARTFLRDAHTEYSAGLIQKSGRGYRMHMTLGQLPKLLSDYLTYIENHSETYRSALNAYLAVCMKEAQAFMPGVVLEEAVGASAEAVNGAANLGEEEFAQVIEAFGSIKEVLNSLSENETFRQFEDSYYTAEISRQSRGVYEAKVDAGFLFNGAALASLSTTSQTRAKDVTVEMPESQMSGEEFTAILDQLGSEYNPVNALTLEWDEYDFMYDDFDGGDAARMMWAERETEQREPIWRSQGDGGLVSYENKDGRLYVKLRDVCSLLRLTPQWNANIEKAYVQVGSQSVYFEGYQREQATWIAVRELEKLGYSVSYENLDGMNMVTVSRMK